MTCLYAGYVAYSTELILPSVDELNSRFPAHASEPFRGCRRRPPRLIASPSRARRGRGPHPTSPPAPPTASAWCFTQWERLRTRLPGQDLETSRTAARRANQRFMAFGNVSAEGKCHRQRARRDDAWADYVRRSTRPTRSTASPTPRTSRWPGNFNQLRELKAARLKVMISLGGWGWSTHFSDAAHPRLLRPQSPPASSSGATCPPSGTRGASRSRGPLRQHRHRLRVARLRRRHTDTVFGRRTSRELTP